MESRFTWGQTGSGWALNPMMGVLVRKHVKTWVTDTERRNHV